MEGSGVGSGGYVVHFDVHRECCGLLQCNCYTEHADILQKTFCDLFLCVCLSFSNGKREERWEGRQKGRHMVNFFVHIKEERWEGRPKGRHMVNVLFTY